MKTHVRIQVVPASAPQTARREGQGPIKLCWPIVLGLALTLAAGQAQSFTTIKSFGILSNISGFHPRSTFVQGADGTLYGTTYDGEDLDWQGGNPVAGTVFRLQPDGSGFSVLKWFTNFVEGANPLAGLALSDTTLYGTTLSGGTGSNGTVFKVNTDGTGFTILKHFSASNFDPTNADGAQPYASLTLSGSVLYGTTISGGTGSNGTVFKLNTDGTGYAVLHKFAGAPDGATDGSGPSAGLTLLGTVLYGTTGSGGSWNHGTVFSVNTDGTDYTVLYEFAGGTDGEQPWGLALSDTTLYGTTYSGGLWQRGTVFQINTDGTGYFILKDFAGGSDGSNPYSGLTLLGTSLYGTTYGVWDSLGTVFQINTDGTGYTVLKNFTNSPDGAHPMAGVMLSGGTLYGTTVLGGSFTSSGFGTVFKLNTDGTDYAVLKSFTWSDGYNPNPGVTLSGNVLYGTTSLGGSGGNNGTVFKVNTDGTGYAVLKNFSGSDVNETPATVTFSGGMLYGTTSGRYPRGGSVFKLSTNGTGYTVLKDSSNDPPLGASTVGPLTPSGSVLFATTPDGGNAFNGTVFKLNTDGTGYARLKSFSATTLDPSSGFYTNSDGASPRGALTLSGSTLYGTTEYGGSSGYGTVFQLNTNGTGYAVLKNFTGGHSAGLTLSGAVLFGTAGGGLGSGMVFRLNTDGTGYTVLKEFAGTDGGGAWDLTVSGSTLYGTGGGGIVKLNTNGTGYTVLYEFAGGADGKYPNGGLALSGGTLYGTTSQGGGMGYGTVFKLDLSAPMLLSISPLGNAVVLSWENPAFALQAAPALTGTYTNIPSATSPFTNTISGARRFFRLIGD